MSTREGGENRALIYEERWRDRWGGEEERRAKKSSYNYFPAKGRRSLKGFCVYRKRVEEKTRKKRKGLSKKSSA